jgi:hypothetical protein
MSRAVALLSLLAVAAAADRERTADVAAEAVCDPHCHVASLACRVHD